ncbi:MAG: MMPL family transporter [Thermoleophilia bacterium]|nr:MMPL family transporter [Thermoleophilia bacterium]
MQPGDDDLPASPHEPVVLGPMGRFGAWTVDHMRIVVVAWVIIAIGLGFFAPRVETALSGAGWEATGSESVQARELIDANFAGQSSAAFMVVVHSKDETIAGSDFGATVDDVVALLDESTQVGDAVPPQQGVSISQDGHTAIVMAGAKGSTKDMVEAANDLKADISAAGHGNVRADLTGSSGMWSDFNEANRDAMMKSEMFSWPVTMAILLLAFGSLVAAGLPLMLTILGLVASAGMLYLGTHVFDISIWAMNFALMFALALGIDYALFIVHRFRGAYFGSHLSIREAVGQTMDTAGKAVLFSGLTVLVSLTAVMLVPSPAFRSMALGIMVSVMFVLAASLTLLPAVLGKLGRKVDALSLPWVHQGEHRSKRFEAWGKTLWKHPWAFGLASVAVLVALAIPVLNIDTGMPSIKVVPDQDSSRIGYVAVQDAFGTGAPGALQVVADADQAEQVTRVLSSDSAIDRVMPAQPGKDGQVLLQAVPNVDPSDPKLGDAIDRLRSDLPDGALLGGAVAENHDLEAELGNATPKVIGVVLALGFLLLLVALQAPLIALLGVVTNLLAVAAAFGVGTMIFQDGNLEGLLGYESQGFLNAWAPVFFFAMIFAISMDYTVFLLASAKEHFDKSNDPEEAMVGGVAHSGRVIFAAAAVMVAVFFTFALSGPLPPKEMGVILGVAVLLDAALIRLMLVPVLLRLTGRAAWTCPRWLRRILPDVRFGH